MKKLLIICLVVPLMTGCSANRTVEEEPVGIGTGRNELKQSPCACTEIPQNYDDWTVKAS